MRNPRNRFLTIYIIDIDKVSEIKYLHTNQSFKLENGQSLPNLTIAYHTYGQLNPEKDNVIWVCHALTANSDVSDWWEGLVGPNKVFDPQIHFIVCANMLGSCYGTTGPTFKNPNSESAYGLTFPLITIRDMVDVHEILLNHLGINQIKLIIGGSMGGQQALEWAIQRPNLFDNICLLATNAVHSPWGIAFNEAQRMALSSDPTFSGNQIDGGHKGLEAARAVAMLSYRSYMTYQNTQSELDDEQIDDFKASSYQRYQGLKLRKRFNAFSYYSLSKSMDSHNVGRGRKSIPAALRTIRAKTLVIGISTDVLFPVSEQRFLAEHISEANYHEIDSDYGHDGFLVEEQKITELIHTFLTIGKLNNQQRNGFPRLDINRIPGSEPF